jgi:hypothetical protein
VDLVAVCSPDQFHAEQVVAACTAGKRGILVEKPLAVARDEAASIRDASVRFGVPIVVGAMHSWDPAWLAASKEWLDSDGHARLIRSTIHLPVNSDIMHFATDLASHDGRRGMRVPAGLTPRLGAARRRLRPPDRASREARLRAVILGFAVHAIPLIRVLAPALGSVVFARPAYPWGYSVAYDAAQTAVTMTGTIGGHWTPTWTFDAWEEDRRMHVDFPPAFVMAGSGEASISDLTRRVSWRMPHNGYLAEWLHLADVAEGRAELAISVSAAVDDYLHALSIANAGAEWLHRDVTGS